MDKMAHDAARNFIARQICTELFQPDHRYDVSVAIGVNLHFFHSVSGRDPLVPLDIAHEIAKVCRVTNKLGTFFAELL